MFKPLVFSAAIFLGGCSSSMENQAPTLKVMTIPSKFDSRIWLEKGHEGKQRILVSADGERLAFDFGKGAATIIDASPRRIELQDSAPDRPAGITAGPRAAASKYYKAVLRECFSRAEINREPLMRALDSCQSEIWKKTGTLAIKVGDDYFTVDIVDGRVFVAAD